MPQVNAGPASSQTVNQQALLIGSVNPTFIPNSLTTADIQAAINAASAAGGGIVPLPAQTINLTGALILKPNVAVIGGGWSNQVGSGDALLGGGTILQGNGTFDCFDYNNTDLGAPYASGSLLSQSLLQMPSVQNLAMTGFIYGIKCGALYQGGAHGGFFSNLYATQCSAWGFWFENFSECLFDTLRGVANGHGIGFFASGGALYNFGNSTMRRIFGGGNLANGNGRAVACQSRNASQMNNINFYDLAAGGNGPQTSTQAATMQAAAASVITNTSANIAVTNTCVAGEIVLFSAAVGTGGSGVATGTNYYVLASGLSGTNIQVSATLGGAAITFNASGTPNVQFTKIGITDLSKVGVGMAIHFSAAVNGLQTNVCYFVLQASGTSGAGWISITGAMSGNTAASGLARASTGASAVNAVINGWQSFQAGGADPVSVVTFISSTGNSDMEASNAPRLVLDGVQGGEFHLGVSQFAGVTFDLVFAQCQNLEMHTQQSALTLSMDAASGLTTHFYGTIPLGVGGQQTGLGFKIAPAGRASLNLSQNCANGADDIALMPTLFQLQLNNALALMHSQKATGSALATGDGNLITYTSGVGTLTLPNLTAVTMVGWQYWVSNPGAGTLTVSATQNIVGLGVSGTSVTVATLQTALFVAHNNAGTMYWAQYK